ncbi:MAG: response regulator [Nitrospirae bacterium]|nr:response regulator [Nitrospirota bacterium]
MADSEVERLKAEITGLNAELERYKERERDLEDSRRAMLYMLEDLNESSAVIDRARKEWEATFDGISGPVCLHDSELKVLRANKAYIKEAGIPLDDIVGRPYYEVFPLSEKPFQCCKEATESGCVEEEEVAAESGRTFKVKYYPIRDEAGRYLLSVHIMEDITERIKAEKEKTKLEEQLRHAQKMEAVGTLAGGIAHDFNNMLNVIIGFGTFVSDRLGDDPVSKEQMNEVLSAAERAANLTKRLLVFSRKQAVEVKPVNVNDTILDLKKMLGRIIRENIELDLELAEGRLEVMADTGQIEQVLMNLASNARDAMSEGGRLTIGTGTRELDDEYVAAYGYGKPGKYALITVADTGQGMNEETREKIFEPFFTTKGIGEGTGLGLAISYGIIKQHNGYIKVYSELGKGTEFKIYLPLIEDSTALEVTAEPPGAVKGGNETILLAEDDASLRKLERTTLEAYGYAVITAENGEEAITKFMENREKISLALLDMIMPKKNGKEVAEEIRKVVPGTKTLFVSGYTMDIVKTGELTEAGFDFILKPVLPRDLLKQVREMLDR